MIRKTPRRSLAGIVTMLALAGLSTSLTTGCGFKGPLYLPPPKPATPASQTTAAPIPVDPVESSASGPVVPPNPLPMK